MLLNDAQRNAVENEIDRLFQFRGWKLWTANPRSNHVHVVVTALGYSGEKVRDQLKANSTRVLRESWPVFIERPVWSVGGDWKCINTVDDLEQVITYASEAQDRMEYK